MVYAAHGRGSTSRCAAALLLMVWTSLAIAAVDLIDVGIEEPPEPPAPPKLFAWAVPQQEPQASFEQEWMVAIEQAAIQRPADAIELNLPDREPIIVSRLHWEARAGFIPSPEGYGGQIADPQAASSAFSWRWYGKSDRGYTLALTLVKGQLAGRIWAPANVHYALEPNRDTTTLGLIRPDFWSMHSPEQEDPSEVKGLQVQSQVTPRSRFGIGGSWDLDCKHTLVPRLDPIDVLVMYTPGMITPPPAGTGYASVAQLTTAVQASIDDANQALRNVGIFSFSFTLRGIEPADPGNYDNISIRDALEVLSGIDYTGTGPTWCTFPGNPQVSARRSDMWADVVALARADNFGENSCGQSRAQRHVEILDCPRDPGPGYKQFAYLVFNPKCNPDRLNLAHELGHVVGMEHDPENATPLVPPNKPSCPWSFGHRRADVAPRYRFHTVMAYARDTPAMGGVPGPAQCASESDCPLIDAYSDPLQYWHGYDDGVNTPPFELQPSPVGSASAIGELNHPPWRPSQATDTLRRIAPIVAQFFDRPDGIFEDGFES